jgi:putative sugar O-methyltransferase
MVKIKYLRHPLQTANNAKNLFTTRLGMWRFARHGARRYRNDPRYDLQNVTDGFKSRINDSTGDDALLERICTAYIKAVNQQQLAPSAYQATEWWQEVRDRGLAPVIRALLAKDIASLRRMYGNFFRDSCSMGLLAPPFGMAKAYFGGKIKDVHRHYYLSHVLYRFDYWKEQTNSRFALRDLAGPGIGNPFGVLIDGTHINVGAEYAHYCAHRIDSIIDTEFATVAEIGGGFGGMAYYLLRDRPNLTYFDFDVPESIALASYYLIKAFPKLRFLLYGESDLPKKAIADADVVLLPAFALESMPSESVDVTFSSHAMSDISPGAVAEYLKHIERMTTNCVFYIGRQQGSESISELLNLKKNSFRLSETRTSGWHSHKVSGAGVGGAAGLAASAMFEQCYTRGHVSRGMRAS